MSIHFTTEMKDITRFKTAYDEFVETLVKVDDNEYRLYSENGSGSYVKFEDFVVRMQFMMGYWIEV